MRQDCLVKKDFSGVQKLMEIFVRKPNVAVGGEVVAGEEEDEDEVDEEQEQREPPHPPLGDGGGGGEPRPGPDEDGWEVVTRKGRR
jgi:hypothetical protein